MARGGAVDIPGNGTGQDIASSSTYIHVQGAYGARTGAVSSAADGRQNEIVRNYSREWLRAVEPNSIPALRDIC